MSSYGIWLSAAGMKVNQHRQTLLANNMANVNTTGFKHDLAVVTQRRVETQEDPNGINAAHPVLDELAGGLNVRPSFHDFAQGNIEWTGKPLDVAVDGEGFLAVSDGNATRYTRDGQFTVNETGELVLAVGDGRWRVLDDGGRRITLNDKGGPLSISANGTVRQGRVTVARLGLFAAQNPQGLSKTGANLFDAEDTAMTAREGQFRPESREESNFDVMKGLVDMIDASRAYQMNATMIRLQDQLTGRAVTDVGRSSG
ncbi:MAG: flagellar hook-basal body protein [Phycisphaerae bacterium]|jgi:flagellar basal body rod protein FlgG